MRRDWRALAWTGSALLHLAGAAALVGLLQARPVLLESPVLMVALPAPEPESEAMPERDAPTPLPEPIPAEAIQTAVAPPPEAVQPELPPSPPDPVLAETPPPEPVRAEVPPPPEPMLAEATEDPIALPMPPPAMPPAPRPPRPVAHPRPAPAHAAAAPIEAAAPAATPVAAAAPRVAAPSPSYIAALLAALERQKRYPEEARARRSEGIALLRFRMRRDGSVLVARIERSAGDAALDEAVLAMVRRAAPLPAAPADYPGETLDLTLPVRFGLR